VVPYSPTRPGAGSLSVILPRRPSREADRQASGRASSSSALLPHDRLGRDPRQRRRQRARRRHRVAVRLTGHGVIESANRTLTFLLTRGGGRDAGGGPPLTVAGPAPAGGAELPRHPGRSAALGERRHAVGCVGGPESGLCTELCARTGSVSPSAAKSSANGVKACAYVACPPSDTSDVAHRHPPKAGCPCPGPARLSQRSEGPESPSGRPRVADDPSPALDALPGSQHPEAPDLPGGQPPTSPRSGWPRTHDHARPGLTPRGLTLQVCFADRCTRGQNED
jgi:hypothetical protein